MYSEQELHKLLGISLNALKARIKALKLKPQKGDRNKNLYTKEQLVLLKEQHEHLANGGILSNFATSVNAEIVPANSRSLFRQQNELSDFAQACKSLSYDNPFWDYDLLQRASDKSYYLPSWKLAIIIGRSTSSFVSQKSFTYQGFVIVRQGDRSGNSYVWAINANC